jgi:hypothetical protein
MKSKVSLAVYRLIVAFILDLLKNHQYRVWLAMLSQHPARREEDLQLAQGYCKVPGTARFERARLAPDVSKAT